ncbi:ABC transporter ATP-binding protein [Nitrosovibrio sp. Nv6]|uniref:ABC transporter ATP-binding protein n=1 Tax=Nitrosovibrio sp. Nv6 TaxID=1855340 RepID=UPI0008C5E5B1|nr:ABC transporter ATP-binding protein [Nitrosovibrio sp. Nv6]SEP17760.1 spermidine/putrescine transport system ATP-binding protein [Nitrosovibrio sp. Nv6]
MALLEIRNVTRRFSNYTAVDNVSISVKAGEFFTLLGPSGCGKTTLLRMIAGFDLPDSGQILLDGTDMVGTPPEKRPVHTVFQTYALFPHMTVADNIAFPLKMAGKTPQEIKTRVGEALDSVRLPNFGSRFPHELSGGQKQRVAFARGLVNRPRLLLLDEPLGALDAKLREEMQIELINLQKELGITFVFVTHAQDEALALSHRIAVMNRGNVEQIDEPSRIYSFPRNRFVADFIGKISMMNAHVVETAPSHLKLDVKDLGEVTAAGNADVKVGDNGVMAIRPEQIRISHPSAEPYLKNHFLGKVHDFLYVGDVTTYIVELSNGIYIEALLPNSAPGRATFFEVGDQVGVSWRHDVGIFLND